MLGVFAEFEKAMITLRMKNGRNSAVAKGRWHGGHIYGYNHGKNGQLVINEHEAEIVKKIYNLKRYKKLSASKIAKLLNNEKIKTKRGTTKWHSLRACSTSRGTHPERRFLSEKRVGAQGVMVLR